MVPLVPKGKQMVELEIATTFLLPNEPAYLLVELNLPHPIDNKGKYRYQMIWVNRNDQITRFTEELGPTEAFTAPQLRIPSLWEHTVAELRYMADEERLVYDYWTKRSVELAVESTLAKDFADQLEETQKIIHNQSVFGQGQTTQRNNTVPRLRRG